MGGCLNGRGTCLRTDSRLRHKLLRVKWNIAVDVSSNFCSLWDRDVLAVHEEKERSGREKDNGGFYHRTCHLSRINAPPFFFFGSPKGLFSLFVRYIVFVFILIFRARPQPQ